MRRLVGLVAASLLVTLTAVGAAAPPASAHHTELRDGGEYYYHDIVDGSNLTIQVFGHADSLGLYDDAGSICSDRGHGFVPAYHYGPIVHHDAHTFEVTGDVWCQTKAGWQVVVESLTVGYEVEPGGASMQDQWGQPYKFRNT